MLIRVICCFYRCVLYNEFIHVLYFVLKSAVYNERLLILVICCFIGVHFTSCCKYVSVY